MLVLSRIRPLCAYSVMHGTPNERKLTVLKGIRTRGPILALMVLLGEDVVLAITSRRGGEIMPGNTWQDDCLDALAHEPSKRVILMRAATMWAVPSQSDFGRFYFVLAASQEAKTLKVCCLPLRGSTSLDLDAKIREHLWGTANRPFVLVSPETLAAAIPHPSDDTSFLYDLATTYEDRLAVAEPCKSYRYRDTCWHIGQVPLETIREEPT